MISIHVQNKHRCRYIKLKIFFVHTAGEVFMKNIIKYYMCHQIYYDKYISININQIY